MWRLHVCVYTLANTCRYMHSNVPTYAEKCVSVQGTLAKTKVALACCYAERYLRQCLTHR